MLDAFCTARGSREAADAEFPSGGTTGKAAVPEVPTGSTTNKHDDVMRAGIPPVVARPR